MEFKEEIEKLFHELKIQKDNFSTLQNERHQLKELIEKNEAAWGALETEYKMMLVRLLDEISNLKQGVIQKNIVMESEKKNEVGIIIVTYNQSQLIKKQVECIRWFCKDDADIIIVDNSTDADVIAAIQFYNNDSLHCKYYKTTALSKNGSDSHSFAANLAYMKFKDDYRYLFFIDHDNFPVKDFSVKGLLDGKVMAGLGQKPKDTLYMWAGCVMFDLAKIEPGLINFSTSHDLQCDTGGMLCRIIERYGEDRCVFFDEVHVQNPNFNKSMYNFYALINGGGFMHFINSSSWNPSEANEERINSLLNILDEKLAGK